MEPVAEGEPARRSGSLMFTDSPWTGRAPPTALLPPPSTAILPPTNRSYRPPAKPRSPSPEPEQRTAVRCAPVRRRTRAEPAGVGEAPVSARTPAELSRERVMAMRSRLAEWNAPVAAAAGEAGEALLAGRPQRWVRVQPRCDAAVPVCAGHVLRPAPGESDRDDEEEAEVTHVAGHFAHVQWRDGSVGTLPLRCIRRPPHRPANASKQHTVASQGKRRTQRELRHSARMQSKAEVGFLRCDDGQRRLPSFRYHVPLRPEGTSAHPVGVTPPPGAEPNPRTDWIGTGIKHSIPSARRPIAEDGSAALLTVASPRHSPTGFRSTAYASAASLSSLLSAGSRHSAAELQASWRVESLSASGKRLDGSQELALYKSDPSFPPTPASPRSALELSRSVDWSADEPTLPRTLVS